MIIYQDLISHDGMFSDIYKIQEIADRLFLQVEERMETIFTKEAYKYLKDYKKSVKGKLEEQRPERVKSFMVGLQNQSSTSLLISKTTSSLLVKT
ncbi:hypothetical protein mRhiFer1_017461 [Rhinolophus ferrumequinum]|uniref:TCTP domain-containing protein n=1 Tax=Rhinolophus ferrumequinum TaxID=59479 RepID=A0A7J7ZT75_RHIFE|nr:hypothetical protein mRhiFer1_017461 [Rhinolophus ferrumequinum]